MAKIKILYVEDEPFLGRIVKESLESRDFEVVMVTDGKEALPQFKISKPDICVLDIMLPTKDGYTIAQEIRKTNPVIPLIFVTAKTQTEDLLKGFEVGGNDFLRKPFSMEELIARIHNLLALSGNGNKTTGEKITLGKYDFYPNRYELHFDKEVKKLSHREASLLEVLVSTPNKTIERKEILLKLWGDDSFFNSRNLDVYITKIRDYLKSDPSIELITIKGIGYRFILDR